MVFTKFLAFEVLQKAVMVITEYLLSGSDFLLLMTAVISNARTVY